MQNQQFFKRSRFYLLTLLSITFLGSCSLPKLPQNRENTTPEALVNPNTQSDRPVDINPTDPNFVVTAVQKVGSAVVRINAARTVSRQTPDEFDDPRMEQFFGSTPPSRRVERGTGSGFIVNAGG